MTMIEKIAQQDMTDASKRLLSEVKYGLFKMLLDSNLSLRTVCRRAGIRRPKLERLLLTMDDMTVRDIGVLTYALDCRSDIRLVPKEGGWVATPNGILAEAPLHRERSDTRPAPATGDADG